MSDSSETTEVHIISDRDGYVIFGNGHEIDRFLFSAGVDSRDIRTNPNLSGLFAKGAAAAQVSAGITANSGRWVKLTKESAELLSAGTAMKGSSSSVSRAILTSKGKTTKILEFLKPGQLTSMLTNPVMLAGAAGIMSQMAMQQTLEEITEYLAIIDEKVDDVLRAQKDAAVAQMVGVGASIDEAMTIRLEVGRVSDVTWSKIQHSSQTLHQAQAYALLQLDGLASKLEKKTKVAELYEATGEAETKVSEWLAVLARSFQLQDAIAILELDRVFDESPEEMDKHRKALQIAREKRRKQISASVEQLVHRLDSAANAANEQVLLHPIKAAGVIRSGNTVGARIIGFSECVGIDFERDALDSKGWRTAAREAKDKAVETTVAGVDSAKRLGGKAIDGAADLGEDALQGVAKFGAGALDGAIGVAKKASKKLNDTVERLKDDD